MGGYRVSYRGGSQRTWCNCNEPEYLECEDGRVCNECGGREHTDAYLERRAAETKERASK